MQEPPVDVVQRISKYARVFLLVAACLGVLALTSFVAINYFEQRRDAAAARRVAPTAAASPELRLTSFAPVLGTSVFRAQLVTEDEGGNWASYEKGRPSRNLLFANSETGSAHWLLDDNGHEIVELKDLPDEWGPQRLPPRVSVALVKPRSERPALANGDLLIFDPAGGRVVKVADRVRAVAAANIVGEQTLSLVYERDRKFFIAQYTLDGFRVVLQKEMSIPKVK